MLLAIALAMDSTAVAAGRAVTGLSRREAIVLAGAFGVFQAGMAAIGWGLGATAKDLVERWDHWIAFGLLTLIGGKLLFEASREHPVERPAAALELQAVVALSLATSIDALAAGITLPLLEVPAALALVLIGGAAGLLSLGGAFLGAALGARTGKRLEVFGGLTLIAIGLKTLLEHLGQGDGVDVRAP